MEHIQNLWNTFQFRSTGMLANYHAGLQITLNIVTIVRAVLKESITHLDSGKIRSRWLTLSL